MKAVSPKQGFILIISLVMIWSLNWPVTKIALEYTPPFLFSGMRTFLGGLILLSIFWPKLRNLNLRKNWGIYSISAIFNVILYYGLQTIGLHYLPSGLFSVIVFLQPILVGMMAWIWLQEKMTKFKLIGLILGIIGELVISEGSFSGEISIVGVLLAVGTAVSWAIGTVYAKKIEQRVDVLSMIIVQFIMGGIILTAIGASIENWRDIQLNFSYMFGLLFGAILVIALGWFIYFTLVRHGEASKVASYMFVIPIVALIIGALFLNEPITFNILVGIIMVTMSIYFVNRKPKKLDIVKIQS
ncbi:DMT family transporter [Bacillus cabrialesii]|uniref:DMT family transporter n=1 Tax=Bacillus cabrialesii TaxID=2487276 RepID=UPI003CF1E692